MDDMKNESDITETNRQAWDEVAADEESWFVVASPEEIESARAGNPRVMLTATKPLPMDWLGDLQNRNVLCLAGGGGQQGPILAAAGAVVTVLDFSEQQLAKDTAVAERESLELKTVQADMRDLSMFADQTFDLIVNPTSVNYCDDVEKVWRECFRVLRSGGELLCGMINPINYLCDPVDEAEGELNVVNKIPYAEADLDEEIRNQLWDSDHALEYGHTLETLIGGQLQAGFRITGYFDDRWGAGDELSEYVAVFLATRAVKV